MRHMPFLRAERSFARGSTLLRGAACLALVAGSLSLGGCLSFGKDDDSADVLALAAETEPADVLYNQGLANLEGGRLGEAAKKFEAIDPIALGPTTAGAPLLSVEKKAAPVKSEA